MKSQQWGIYSPKDYGSDSVMDEGDLEEDDWIPSLSQGSTISNLTGEVHTPGGNKRRFLDEEEGEGFLFGEAFMQGGEGVGLEERVLAVPRRKKWGSTGHGAVGRKGSEQEHSRVVSRREDDFQDAEFLDYGLVREVEMSG